ncbi:MAG: ComF family protein [Flavobacteriaceae bacterium]|jgi:ComF family protein
MLIALPLTDQFITMKENTCLNRFSFFGDLAHLVFPQVCISCSKELSISEKNICSICTSELLETNFHLSIEPTSMDKLFWGRFDVHKTYAHLFFEKEKSSQHVLFSLKYQNNPNIGYYFGTTIGRRLKTISAFDDIDVFIPAPLHPKKEFLRGYNQSESIAKGIGDAMSIPVDLNSVLRSKHGSTQTKKSRFERWDNVQSTFKTKKTIKAYKHIVLVDDVITTGSTLESIAQSIRAIHPEVRISIVTLAIS